MWKLIILTTLCNVIFGNVLIQSDHVKLEAAVDAIVDFDDAAPSVVKDFRVKFYDMCNTTSTTQARCVGSLVNTDKDDGSCFITRNCTRGAAVEYTASGYVFHIMGIKTSYMALGFSQDKDMGNDSVVSCHTDDPVTMHISFNVGLKNEYGDNDDGLNMIAAARDNGDLYCKFYLDDALAFARHNWTQTDTDFYMLVVSGDMHADGSISHHKGYGYSEEKWHYEPAFIFEQGNS